VNHEKSATFNPASIVNSGRSTLTISANRNARRGTYPITITGTSSAGVRSVTTSLTIGGGVPGGSGGPVGPPKPAGPAGPASPASPRGMSGSGNPVTP